MARPELALVLIALASCDAVELGPGTQPPPLRPTDGRQQVVVLMVAAGCAASSRKDLPNAVAAVKRDLARIAAAAGRQLITLGVALDQSSDVGLKVLRRFGEFDQVMVGAGWLNEGAVRFIWRDVAGAPVLPQMLLIERTVTVGDDRVHFGADQLLTRAVGGLEIAHWAARLGKLPSTQ